MKAISATPDRVLLGDRVYNRPIDEAEELILAGAAVEYNGKIEPTRVPLTPDPEDVPDDEMTSE